MENNGKSQSNKDLWWERRLEKSIKERRKDLSKLEEVKKGNHRLSMSEKKRRNWKYQPDVKCYLYIKQQLKVKISRACINIRQYNENQLQYHQNKLFNTNQSRLYSELNGDSNSINESPDPEVAAKFSKDIWATPTGHNRNAEWLREVKIS